MPSCPPGRPAFGSGHLSDPAVKCDSMVLVVNQSGLRGALDRTSGTVTDFLEQLVGEKIDAHTHRHDIVGAHNATALGVEEAEPLLHRGPVFGVARPAVHTSTRKASVSSVLPGRVLQSARDEYGPDWSDTRGDGDRCNPSRSRLASRAPRSNSDVTVHDYLLARTYRIDSEQAPVMIITEWFLKTLIPFLSLAPENK